MKVKDLVKHLLKGDQEAEVAVFDHFGRPMTDVTTSDFLFMTYKPGESPQGLTGSFLRLSHFDIGPEPE